jgi:hypothetical protein
MKFTANDFTTDLPDNWQDRSMLTLVGPTDGAGFAPNVVIMRQPVSPQTSIEDYARQQRAVTEAEIPDLEVLDERPTTVNNAPAYQRLQRFTAQGRRLQQAQTYVLGHSVIFVITCTALLENFDKQINAFRRVVDHFQLSPRPPATF